GGKSLQALRTLQALEHLRRLGWPAEREVDIGAKELDVIPGVLRDRSLNPRQGVQRILGLILLKLDASQTVRRLVLYRLLHIRIEHCPDRPPGTQMHPVAELEVADRKVRLPDVILERIELRLVDATVLSKLGIEPFQGIEILSLIGLVQRFAEIE